MKWPRGKDNNKKIIGFRIMVFFNVTLWRFKAHWDMGQPYFCIGPVKVKAEISYKWSE